MIPFMIDCAIFQNPKLKKSMKLVRTLEEKLQNALKAKQKEDDKLWRGMESKFSSTKTLREQLTETLQILAGQVKDGIFSPCLNL